jgi:Kef-type K+ transport system membrane component KefB
MYSGRLKPLRRRNQSPDEHKAKVGRFWTVGESWARLRRAEIVETLIIDIGLCIISAWVLAVAFQILRQPLLLAYLVAGFLIGPHGFRWVIDHHSIDTIASVGLILLLFLIGLEIDLKKMISAGRRITLTGLCQIAGCLALGWVFFKLTGLANSWLEGLYLGVAAALSSTVIIIKVLHDKHEIETLAGRITVGILVLQDLFAILFLAVQSGLTHPSLGALALALGKVILVVAVGLSVSRFVLPPVFHTVAHVPELILVGALAWCFALSGLADLLGLSREMGALIAGVALSTFPYALDVTSKVTSLRDFFLTLFFVGLGMSIPVPTISLVLWIIAWSVFVVVSRLLTVFPPLYLMRQGHRVSLLPAINLCQISELSLVLLALGKALGDVSERSFSVVALAFAFLAVNSTYAVFANDAILRRISPWLTRFGLPDLPAGPPGSGPDVGGKRIFLLGFSWTASSFLEAISRRQPELVSSLAVVDFNPQVIESLRRRGVHVLYGDVSQTEVLVHAGIGRARLIICSLPNSVLKGTNNLKLLTQLRALAPEARIIVHAERLDDASRLYETGADYVLTPRILEADELLDAIEAGEKDLLAQKRQLHQGSLSERNEIVP